MRRALHIVLVIFAVILAFLSFTPVSIEPTAWQPQQPPSSETGPYARNELLKGIKHIAPGSGKGPEAIAFDAQGRVYTGLEYGRIVRFEADGSGAAQIANTGGDRLAFSSIPTAASSFAMPSTDSEGRAGRANQGACGRGRRRAASFRERPRGHSGRLQSLFYGHLDEVPLSASQRRNLEHGGHGRFLVYDFATGKAQVLLRKPAVCERRGARPGGGIRAHQRDRQLPHPRYWLKGGKPAHRTYSRTTCRASPTTSLSTAGIASGSRSMPRARRSPTDLRPTRPRARW